MKRAVRNVIRLLAFGLIVFGGMEAGLEFVRHRVREGETNSWHYIIGSLLILTGIVIFAVSSKVAARLTDEYDDEPSPPSSAP